MIYFHPNVVSEPVLSKSGHWLRKMQIRLFIKLYDPGDLEK